MVVVAPPPSNFLKQPVVSPKPAERFLSGLVYFFHSNDRATSLWE
ncbi:hypothetical protein [Rubritalea tangerina]